MGRPDIGTSEAGVGLESAFTFTVRTTVRMGPGEVRSLGRFLRGRQARSVVVVVDAALNSHPGWTAALDEVRGVSASVRVLYNAVSEPDYEYLEARRADLAGPPPDVMVGVGGGSTLDLTKALSVLFTNLGPAISYRGFDKVRQPGPPVIAVPTTAGTGSEVTPNAVFTDRQEMRKLGINTALYVPLLVILDPELVTTCPTAVTISAGLDAIVHAVESFAARAATPVSRLFSKAAFHLMVRALPHAVEEPGDLAARAATQLGALYAGVALMNAGPGPAGALSYPLGVRFKVPHGLAGGVFLARVAARNVSLGCDAYADLAPLILEGDPGGDRLAASQRFCDALQALCDQLEVPRTLRAFGVSGEDVPVLTKDTMLLSGALAQNPVAFPLEEVQRVLETMM